MNLMHKKPKIRNTVNHQRLQREPTFETDDTFLIEEQIGLTKTAGTVPFVMVVFSMFLKGALFLFVNGPLLYSLLNGKQYASLSILFRNGLVQTWVAILTSDMTKSPFASSLLLLLLSLIVGLFVTPLERIFSSLTIMTVNVASGSVSGPRFYSSGATQASEYTSLLSWLMYNPSVASP